MNAQLMQLGIAFAVTAAGMLIGLLVMRAGGRAYWRWPVYSVMVMVLGVVSWNLLRKHVLPPEWIVIHARAMYFSALALYVLLGLSLGALLGRLTREVTSKDTR